MTLIKSISGIRGTIGGQVGNNLTPPDVVKFSIAYGIWLKENFSQEKIIVAVGRDARLSGSIIQNLVQSTLISLGIHVLDLGLSTTPSVEMCVILEQLHGGIIITASHNPKHWNALKLLNHKGEFIDNEEGNTILQIAERDSHIFEEVNNLGSTKIIKNGYIDQHINAILNLPLVNIEEIQKANFKIAIDAVNSTGGIAVPKLLNALGVNETLELYCTPNGLFPHNPEPLEEHLSSITALVKDKQMDLGIVVDPDVDRLAIICENGNIFGEEYTLVAVADYILSCTPGNTVSNLSSSRALKDITEKYGGEYTPTAVGEVNVVSGMKSNNAVIGGEGNGGVIYPSLHYGRDSLVGIALFLTYLAKKDLKVSELRKCYPSYFQSKNKVELTNNIDLNAILKIFRSKYKDEVISTIDGVKIDFENEWVHLRKSNTEPIVRIYTEATSKIKAEKLANNFVHEIKQLLLASDK